MCADRRLIKISLHTCLTICFVLKETPASCTGQEECREGGQKNTFQESPLSPKGKLPLSQRLIYRSVDGNNQFHFPSPLCQATPARKPAQAKDDSFFGAFQGLSLEGLMGNSNGSPGVAAPGDQCKVM